MLPRGLVEDIQQFQVEDFAKRYFSTHRAGFLFRRRIPVEQLMTWQKVCIYVLEQVPSWPRAIPRH